MKIFFPVGRLGNHIFQYFYVLSKTSKNEIIITSYSEFFNTFECNDRIVIKIPKYVRYFVRKFFYLLRDYNLIGRIYQNELIIDGHLYHDTTVTESNGLLSKIHSIDDGYYMANSFFSPEIIDNTKIKKKYLDDAFSFINDIDKNKKKIFVHIRRTDYKVWGVLGNTDSTLPLSYYKDNIEFFSKKYDCLFIFLGDDYNYMKEKFDYIDNKIISRNSASTDLAIMTICDGGILSPSTFAFWGANLMQNSCEIIAPKYWLGFRDKIWYPLGIENKKFIYKEIIE